MRYSSWKTRDKACKFVLRTLRFVNEMPTRITSASGCAKFGQRNIVLLGSCGTQAHIAAGPTYVVMGLSKVLRYLNDDIPYLKTPGGPHILHHG